jgi:hypothetical protein
VIAAFVPAFLLTIGMGGSVFSFITPLPQPVQRGQAGRNRVLDRHRVPAYLAAPTSEHLNDTGEVFIEEEASRSPPRCGSAHDSDLVRHADQP